MDSAVIYSSRYDKKRKHIVQVQAQLLRASECLYLARKKKNGFGSGKANDKKLKKAFYKAS